MRSEFATALVSAVESDRSLLDAITVLEARNPGFIGRMICRAEAVAVAAIADPDAPSRPTLVEASVLSVLRTPNVKLVLDSIQFLPTAEAANGLMDILVAQARFHLVAEDLERRDLERRATGRIPERRR